MLAIHPTHSQKCTPNLLPVRINHNGPVNDTERYWKPETDEKGTSHTTTLPSVDSLTLSAGTRHAYFRGRHLHGTVLPLPENYTGAVLHVTDRQVPQAQSKAQQPRDDDDEGEDEDEDMEVVQTAIAEQVGEFDEVIVWGHGGQVDEAQDGLVRGVREWIGWAESMHVDDEEKEDTQQGEKSSKKE
jgi:ribonuclease H2 subunit C